MKKHAVDGNIDIDKTYQPGIEEAFYQDRASEDHKLVREAYEDGTIERADGLANK